MTMKHVLSDQEVREAITHYVYRKFYPTAAGDTLRASVVVEQEPLTLIEQYAISSGMRVEQPNGRKHTATVDVITNAKKTA